MQHKIVPPQHKLSEIADFLLDYDYNELSTIGIRYGKLGIALFLLIYGKHSKSQKFSDKADQIISDVIKDLLNGNLSTKRPRENLVDFGRFMEFTNKHKLYASQTNCFLQDLDVYFTKEMKMLISIGDYDVIDGALSIGYYYILRFNSQPEIKEELAYLVKSVYNMGKVDAQGDLYWVSTLFDGDRIYLGVHGSAQIILFAEKLLKLGIEQETCLTIIRKASNFIKKNTIDSPVCKFPVVIGYPIQRGPLEWAYGDLQVAYSLMIAGLVLNDVSLQKLAAKAYRFSSERIMIDNVVVDAGLVHGIMGTAIMFNKMYQLTDEKVFKEAVRCCCNRAIDQYFTHDSPYLKYQAKYEIDIPGSHVSFISGLSGIGIAFLAIEDQSHHYFDELLFL